MTRFNNLRLAYRLGIAFGAMVLALVVIGAVSVSKMSALDWGAHALTEHDMVSQQHVLDLQSGVQRTAFLTVSHLYVHDGDLAAQDRVAKEIATITKDGDAELNGLQASADDRAVTPLTLACAPPAPTSSRRTTPPSAARATRPSARTRSATARAATTPARSCRRRTRSRTPAPR
jgi:Four helix bundle sensory module for signal transduction